jgi:AcrR family transcriptional regulator
LKPRRKPVQGRSRETVTAIVQAAAQVFERHGYAAGTTNRIAERAGISIGSLYQYFPNKDAILVALTEHHLEDGRKRLVPLLAEMIADPPPIPEGLERIVKVMVELHRDAPRLHRVLFEECPRPAELQERLEDAYTQAVGAIEAWLKGRPEVVVRDRRLAAEIVAQVVEGVTHRLVIHPEADREPYDYATEATVVLSRYLLPTLTPSRAR